MAAFRIQIDQDTIYDGEPVAVPARVDDIRHGGQAVRVEAVAWDFSGDGVVVTLVVGSSPYTF